MPGTLTAIPSDQKIRSSSSATVDPRLERAKPELRRFLALAGQLALLLCVFRLFRVEQYDDAEAGFFGMCALCFGAFAIHYWLPFHLKERFWIAVSLLGAGVFFDWHVGLTLIGVGGVFYLVLSSPLQYWQRVTLVAAAFLAATQMYLYHVFTGRDFLGQKNFFWYMEQFWPVFGGIFVFRMVIYLHDLRYMKGRPPLKDYLAYFFILPNYYFLFFPVVDYQTMRLSFYRRNIHDISQQGIQWICRGTIQLLVYQLVQYLKTLAGAKATSVGSLIWLMLLTFLLYLRVSGQFHIIIGLLHLFGYDLPEANDKYLLSRSITDFWRRINIYWKDFMVKVVYFPIYFRLRKKGDVRAKLAASGAVFIVTWALHSYQFFWLRAKFLLSWTDAIFWWALGALVMVNVWQESRRPRHLAAAGWRGHLRVAMSVAGTVLLIITLWSLWESPTMSAWVNTMAWWRPAVKTY